MNKSGLINSKILTYNIYRKYSESLFIEIKNILKQRFNMRICFTNKFLLEILISNFVILVC